MPKRVPVESVFVHREGKLVKLPIGEVFDFNAEELADIMKNNPGAVRKPQADVDNTEVVEKEVAGKTTTIPKTGKDAKPAAANAGDL